MWKPALNNWFNNWYPEFVIFGFSRVLNPGSPFPSYSHTRSAGEFQRFYCQVCLMSVVMYRVGIQGITVFTDYSLINLLLPTDR